MSKGALMKRKYTKPISKVHSISVHLLTPSVDVNSSDRNSTIRELELDTEGTYKVNKSEDVW